MTTPTPTTLTGPIPRSKAMRETTAKALATQHETNEAIGQGGRPDGPSYQLGLAEGKRKAYFEMVVILALMVDE